MGGDSLVDTKGGWGGRGRLLSRSESSFANYIQTDVIEHLSFIDLVFTSESSCVDEYSKLLPLSRNFCSQYFSS